MKLLKAAIAAGVLTSVYAVDVDVAVGPFGPIQGAEDRLLARLRRDAAGSRKPAAAARVSHPTGLLVWGESLFATEFRRDRVLVVSTARAAKREGSKKFAKVGRSSRTEGGTARRRAGRCAAHGSTAPGASRRTRRVACCSYRASEATRSWPFQRAETSSTL